MKTLERSQETDNLVLVTKACDLRDIPKFPHCFCGNRYRISEFLPGLSSQR
jgi:hypothetical protein